MLLGCFSCLIVWPEDCDRHIFRIKYNFIINQKLLLLTLCGDIDTILGTPHVSLCHTLYFICNTLEFSFPQKKEKGKNV
jgi:hypothetical protein